MLVVALVNLLPSSCVPGATAVHLKSENLQGPHYLRHKLHSDIEAAAGAQNVVVQQFPIQQA